MRRSPLPYLAMAVSLLLATASPMRAVENTAEPRTIHNAAEIRALPTNVAESKLPVTIRGVVTAAEPDWHGKFVVQDESAGIFVQNIGAQPEIGDFVEVQGHTGPGWFAPVIQSTGWKKLGRATLPAAKQVSIERLMAGVEASQRIEITGLVRSVTYVPSQKTMVEVSIGGYRVRVFPKLPSQLNPRSLVAAKIRARGTVGTAFNAARRQLTAVNLFVPSADDFVIEEPERHPPFEQPALAIDDLAKFRTSATLGERLHVKGVLTCLRPGLDLFIQDDTGGLHLESRQPIALPLGTPIEAVGFLEIVNYQPVLRDAVVQELAEPPVVVHPMPVAMAELRDGRHAGELIVLRGVLLDHSVRPVARDEAAFVGVRTVCTLRNSEGSFTAEYEGPLESAAITAAPLGSLVEIEGVASFESGDDGRPKSVTLLLPEPGALRVIETPSWLTTQRLLIGFAIVGLLLAALVVWLLTVSKKNAMLHFLVAEREKAQRELQLAHDQLEVRVKERTEQLKVEMSVRKAAEVEFRAVLSERTRLARELHDTLDQALTGIMLQLDTAAKLFERNPADAGRPLELARRFLRQSRLELRRSIWDLRSRELEQFDLTQALSMAGGQILDGSNISFEMNTTGDRLRLPEIVEDNLLRIAQESLANVVKHSGATAVTLHLKFRPDEVALEIKDNGSGLVAGRVSTRGEPHFGLLGMTERARRLGGRLDVSGPPGEGTLVCAVIPLRDFATEMAAPRADAVI
ncbi:MAG TPA: histidine kinase [Candidatus Didemnitutus sp.]|nr:histidine kinase [Candidatus Didemnitutus sp.]